MVICFLFAELFSVCAQQNQNRLDYFLNKAEENATMLKENNNLLEIGKLQNDIIKAQNNAFKVDVSSDILVAPFFNSNGKAIDITTTPSANAYGYDVGITNGGLYSAQVNVTKNLFNKAATDNLLFQNQLQNNAISLSSENILHTIKKNVIDAYIVVYQLQLQKNITKELKADIETRLKVVAVLVKNGILLESDYLLMKLDLDAKNLEIQQLEANLNAAKTQLYNICGLPAKNNETLEAPLLELNKAKKSFFFEKQFDNDSLKLIAAKNVFENQYKPQIAAYGNSGLNAVDARNIPHNLGLSAGLRITIPIYDGHQKKINALQSKLKQQSLNVYKQNNNIQLKNNLSNLQDQIIKLKQNIQLTNTQLKQQEEILEIFKGKLVKGQVSVIDYLNLLKNYKLTVNTKLQMQTNLWLLYNQYNFINW